MAEADCAAAKWWSGPRSSRAAHAARAASEAAGKRAIVQVVVSQMGAVMARARATSAGGGRAVQGLGEGRGVAAAWRLSRR